MQISRSNELDFIHSLSLRRPAGFAMHAAQTGLTQRFEHALIRGVLSQKSLTEFAGRLISLADHAYTVRRSDIVGAAGRILSSFPPSCQVEGIGLYYQALNLNRNSHGDRVRGGILLEKVADRAPLKYVARAMLALGGNAFDVADYQTALRFYREAMQIASRDRTFDPAIFYSGRRMTAAVQGTLGDNQGAVAELEKMLPLVRWASLRHPYVYFDYMNTIAVELTEVGRLEQARRASEIALASPFAPAYHEWFETYDDIRIKQRHASRSIASVPQRIGEIISTRPRLRKSQTLMRFPISENDNAAVWESHPEGVPARVLNFQEWKTALRAPNDPLAGKLAKGPRGGMTSGEKLIRLMDLISKDDTDDEMIDEILKAVEQIVGNRQAENPN